MLTQQNAFVVINGYWNGMGMAYDAKKLLLKSAKVAPVIVCMYTP